MWQLIFRYGLDEGLGKIGDGFGVVSGGHAQGAPESQCLGVPVLAVFAFRQVGVDNVVVPGCARPFTVYAR